MGFMAPCYETAAEIRAFAEMCIRDSCQTTHFAPMRAPMLSVTSSFCRNATGPWTMNPLGYSWEKMCIRDSLTVKLLYSII